MDDVIDALRSAGYWPIKCDLKTPATLILPSGVHVRLCAEGLYGISRNVEGQGEPTYVASIPGLLAKLKNIDAKTGTPKTLDDALDQIFGVAPIGDLRNYGYAVIKDFLAQRFGATMLEHSDSSDVLKKLFDEITRRNQ